MKINWECDLDVTTDKLKKVYENAETYSDFDIEFISLKDECKMGIDIWNRDRLYYMSREVC